MTDDATWREHLGRVLDDRVVSTARAGGGCIADAQTVTLASGRRVFVKRAPGEAAMFEAEANGLRELAKAEAIRVPQVIHAEPSMLVLEPIETGAPGPGFMAGLGRRFAALHRFTGEAFGFHEDNWLGSSPQRNTPPVPAGDGWPGFFYEYRLLPQLRLAEERGRVTDDLVRLVAGLEDRIDSVLDAPPETPSLLHGDLWSGNYMVDDDGEPVLIDPAVYYGHREADLAMTSLFGGFTPDFYEAYEEAWPLADGHERRENLYQAYHLLNHLNIFGRSYYERVIERLRSV